MRKYRNVPTTIDGHKFHSKLEAEFYLKCKAWKEEGKIYDFQMQVPFKLHAGIKYILDFQIQTGPVQMGAALVPVMSAKGVYPAYVPGCYRYVEVKGVWTAVAKLKKELFEADYGKLEIHTAKEPWKP